jgi:hypothetical protein
MKLAFALVMMGLGFMGCAGVDLPGTASVPAVEPMPTKADVTAKEKTTIEDKTKAGQSAAEAPAEKNPTPLTKEQCSEKYPVVVGQLTLRQKCVNDSATGSMAQFTAKQQTIISDCADKLLALAERADKGEVAFDVYKMEKQKLRETCNTSIRMAGGTTATAAKTPKAVSTKATNTKSPTTKTTMATASSKK